MAGGVPEPDKLVVPLGDVHLEARGLLDGEDLAHHAGHDLHVQILQELHSVLEQHQQLHRGGGSAAVDHDKGPVTGFQFQVLAKGLGHGGDCVLGTHHGHPDAAAREGKSLDEVAEIAQRYADSMASVTVKSTDATHPQNGMSFGDLGETDLMEIGAGQHGEGGGVRVPMMSSKDTVATVAEALSKKLELKAGDKAFVMINGCGATTMMEMLVLFKDTVEFLKAKGVEVVASMVGEILTVQEAAGFQMNIAKWDDEFIRLWNTPCHTPAYSKE